MSTPDRIDRIIDAVMNNVVSSYPDLDYRNARHDVRQVLDTQQDSNDSSLPLFRFGIEIRRPDDKDPDGGDGDVHASSIGHVVDQIGSLRSMVPQDWSDENVADITNVTITIAAIPSTTDTQGHAT